MKKHRNTSKRSATRSTARSDKRPRKAHKVGAGVRKIRKHAVPRKAKRSGAKRSGAKHSKAAKPSKPQPVAHSEFKKAADEVPTLEQVTITCANCGRPFKVLKLKGLSLEGTICQRCSLGEMELPESFG